MKNLNSSVAILCPLHSSRHIERVDPDPSTKKRTYCAECILQQKDANTLYSTLPTIPDFLESIFVSLTHIRAKVVIPPAQYADIIGKKANNFEKLEKYHKREKGAIETLFEQISKDIKNIINEKKAEYLRLLDEQVEGYRKNCALFETELKKSYPTNKDSSILYLTKDELIKKITTVRTASQLEELLKNFQQTIAQTKAEVIGEGEINERKTYLDTIASRINEIDSLKPVIETKQANLQVIYTDMKTNLKRLIDAACIIKAPTPVEIPKPIGLRKLNFDSTTIKFEEFTMLKDWFPNRYSLTLGLLYRASRDGMNSQAFHSRCDGKGATITFIKGQYAGSSQICVIGGFLDNQWNSEGQWITSNEAFVFSLLNKKRCAVVQPQFAALSHSEYGPIFGLTGDLFIDRNFSRVYVNPGSSYKDTVNIIHSRAYSGNGKIDFIPQEIEVFCVR